MEQELLTLPEHMGSPPDLSGFVVARSFIFCVVFFYLVTIVLSVLRFTDSDYPLCIFSSTYVTGYLVKRVICNVCTCYTRLILNVCIVLQHVPVHYRSKYRGTLIQDI